jgi:hypothetical protein
MPQESQRRPPCSTESKGSPNGDGPCSTATGTEPVLLPAGQLFSQRLFPQTTLPRRGRTLFQPRNREAPQQGRTLFQLSDASSD